MTYWIYDPKRLTSASTLIPYKHQDIGDLLNLMTLSLFLLYMYFYKNGQVEKFGKILLNILLVVLLLGTLTGSKKRSNNNDNFNFNDFNDYDKSLYID